MNSNYNCLTVIQSREKRKETTIKGLRRKIFLLTDMFYLCFYRRDININITLPQPLFMLMMTWPLISRCDPLWPPKNQGRTAWRHAPILRRLSSILLQTKNQGRKLPILEVNIASELLPDECLECWMTQLHCSWKCWNRNVYSLFKQYYYN
jgi:hypothetical protein